MIKSPRKNVPDVGIELGAACVPSGLASNRATATGISKSKLIWDLTFYFMAKIHILLKTHACVAKHGCVAASHNILEGVLLVSYFQHCEKKTNILHHLHLAVFLVPSS